VSLVRGRSGLWEGDFRYAGFDRLHISLGLRWKAAKGKPAARQSVAQAHHDAVERLFRQNRRDMIAQLRLPKGHPQKLTVARLVEMADKHEPLVPLPAPVEPVDRTSPWGTVQEMIDRYLAWVRGHQRKSAGTLATAGAQLKRFARFEHDGVVVGVMAFDRVTSAVVDAYQQGLVEGGAAPNTITPYMMRVGALWTWARKREERLAREERRDPRAIYSPVDPDALYRKTTRRDRFLTADEGSRLLAETPAGLRAYMALGLLAGLRRDEAAFLRRMDVDLEAGIITIAAKDLPDGEAWTPKTKRAARVVPIVPDLSRVLAWHLASEHAGDWWLTPRPHDPAWPWHPRTLQTWVSEIVQRAGLVTGRKDPRGVTYHTLRHTFATHLVSSGVDLYTVAQLLGDTLAVVEETYAHLLPEARAAAVAKLAGVFAIPVGN
jgi:integrase